MITRPHFTGLAIALSVMATGASAQSGRHVVSVFTDSGDPVPNASVSVSQQGIYNTMITDSSGDTSVIQRDLQAPTVVRIEEAMTTAFDDNFVATTIGQHFTYVPDDSGTADGHRLSYYQPLARQVAFNSFQVTDDLESGWTSLSAPGATYDFNAFVAELPTNDIISNYTAYQIGMHVGSFQHGLLIRTDGWVNLDGKGMYLNIDSKGYSYGADGPQVHLSSMNLPGYGSRAKATLHTSDAEGIELTLSGFLAPGDNLILFRDPVTTPMYPADDLGSEIGYTEADPDCTPDYPSCNGGESCTPSEPKSYAQGSGTACATGYTKIGTLFNPGCGSSISEQECTSYKGGVNFKGTIGVIDVGINGEIGGSHCLTVTINEGYRGQGYLCHKACCRDWEWPARSFWGRPYTAHKRTCCSVQGETGTATCKTHDCD